jgi:hypothetical protein
VIAACAKIEGAEIHWGDETGQCSDDVRVRSFAPQGQTPVARVNRKRHGLSIVSTVSNLGTMRWKILDGAFNADTLTDFMRRLVRDAGRKVYLILGNMRVHHRKPVKTWLAEHKAQIEAFHLPSDSPELDPEEMADADLRQGVAKLAPARRSCGWSRLPRGNCAACIGSPGASSATWSMSRFGMPLEFNGQCRLDNAEIDPCQTPLQERASAAPRSTKSQTISATRSSATAPGVVGRQARRTSLSPASRLTSSP